MRVLPSKSKGRKRLMALAVFLHNKAPELKGKFSMATWGKNGRNNNSFKLKEFVAGHCGSTACALGWGTAVPMLREAGLRAFISPRSKNVTMALVDDAGNIVQRSGMSGYSVVGVTNALFGIDDERTIHMFMPLDKNGLVMRLSAKRAAARIRNTIKAIDKEEGWQF